MKSRAISLIVLCLIGLSGCATVPTLSYDEPDEAELYAIADSMEKAPRKGFEPDDLPEEVKAIFGLFATFGSGFP